MVKWWSRFSWVLIVIIFILQSLESVDRNQLSLLMMKGAFYNLPLLASAFAGYQALGESGCQANWMAGKAADLLGKETEKQAAWMKYIECSKTSVALLRYALPMDAMFAEKAITLYPDSVDAIYWYVNAVVKNDTEAAILSYNRIVQIDPNQELAWCRLGSLYEKNQLYDQSVKAYLQCCLHNDPGENGCYGAGRVMEKLGDPRKAIEYYRLSRWQPALDRANELEKHLHP
jgi:tetratricopeptide (TPR) repeat protein